jgi:Fe-S cluster assembly protein SufD
MSTPSPAVEHFLEQYRTHAHALPGAGQEWLARAREGALEHLAERGLPRPREEHWKYTRFTALEKQRFSVPADAPGVTAERAAPWAIPGLECHRLVLVNGRLEPGLSDLGTLPGGARLLSLREALANDPELVANHLGRHTEVATHPLNALNTALFADGAVLHVPDGVTLERPVHLVFLAAPGEETLAAYPRVLVVLGRDARADVVETFGALDDGRYFTDVLTEAFLGENARLGHSKVQREGPGATHVATLQVEQGAHSVLHSYSVSLGAQLARCDINVRLAGPGARCTLNGLFLAGGRQHTDFHTRVDHLVPDCASEETYKGILDGHSRGVFNGRVIVHPDAQRTDARQENHNLLLSRDAEIDTKPQLEIHADDVKCSHGATVGQLDEAMVFYLRTRGIDEAAARAMLVYGFAREVVDRAPVGPLREALGRDLLEHLPNAGDLGDMFE